MVTKKVIVDEMVENAEGEKLVEIIGGALDVVDTVYLFSHWYKGTNDIARERVVLERAPKKVTFKELCEQTFRDMFYNEVLEVSRA